MDLDGDPRCGYGEHEPLERPAYLLADGRRAIKWTKALAPLAIFHDSSPGAGDEMIPCHRLPARHCCADSDLLSGADREVFGGGDPWAVERAMRAQWREWIRETVL